MEFDRVAVPGGDLRIARFGDGERLVIAVHGITASLMAWRAVGEALPPGWSLIAADLRGRGHSADVPGPYGLRRHADDLGLIAEHAGADESTVLAGHSMGAYVAALHGAERRYARVVLVDGGLPLPLPLDMDPDTVLELTLGPAIARLSQTYPSTEAYLDFFKAHPALADHWSTGIEEYVRYDAADVPGEILPGAEIAGPAVRSRVREDAVRQDGRWLLTQGEAIGEALKAIKSPLFLLRAPRGLLNQDVGMLPDELATTWTTRLPGLQDEVVADCNHYTIMFDDRCVQTIADRLTRD
jgi:pimeloyl-ACP methyl ester carboxylesterase